MVAGSKVVETKLVLGFFNRIHADMQVSTAPTSTSMRGLFQHEKNSERCKKRSRKSRHGEVHGDVRFMHSSLHSINVRP